MNEHPIQPIETDARGVSRFRKNHLVDIIAEAYGINELYRRHGSERWFQDDIDQLNQLTGYSVSGAPLSDKCRARVTCIETGGEPTFGEGYDAGYRDAVEKMTEALNEIARGE